MQPPDVPCQSRLTHCSVKGRPEYGSFPNFTLMTTEQYEALAELRYLGRKFLRFSKDFLQVNGGLNPEQYEALLAITAFSRANLTIAQLSERLQVKHHSAINIVDRLVAKKLITRNAATPDRRERYLELTAQGRELITELAAAHHKELCERKDDMIKALHRVLSSGFDPLL